MQKGIKASRSNIATEKLDPDKSQGTNLQISHITSPDILPECMALLPSVGLKESGTCPGERTAGSVR